MCKTPYGLDTAYRMKGLSRKTCVHTQDVLEPEWCKDEESVKPDRDLWHSEQSEVQVVLAMSRHPLCFTFMLYNTLIYILDFLYLLKFLTKKRLKVKL